MCILEWCVYSGDILIWEEIHVPHYQVLSQVIFKFPPPPLLHHQQSAITVTHSHSVTTRILRKKKVRVHSLNFTHNYGVEPSPPDP